MATKVIGYVRVSTEKQADQGVSLEAQQLKLSNYATLYDMEIVDVVVEEGASAKSLEREGLRKVLGALENGVAEGVLVAKLDRLTRSVRDLGYLLEKYFNQFALLSVSEQIDTRSAAGRLVLNVLVSVAQWEREAIGERTRDAMQHKRALGEYTGGFVPYGFSLLGEGKLGVNPAEQGIKNIAMTLRQKGYSYRKICTEMTRRKLLTRSGARFAPTQIYRMVACLDDRTVAKFLCSAS